MSRAFPKLPLPLAARNRKTLPEFAGAGSNQAPNEYSGRGAASRSEPTPRAEAAGRTLRCRCARGAGLDDPAGVRQLHELRRNELRSDAILCRPTSPRHTPGTRDGAQQGREMEPDVPPVAEVAGVQLRLGPAAGWRRRWWPRCTTSRASPASRSRPFRTSSTTTRTCDRQTRERVLDRDRRARLPAEPLGARAALGQDRRHRPRDPGAAAELLRRARGLRSSAPPRRRGRRASSIRPARSARASWRADPGGRLRLTDGILFSPERLGQEDVERSTSPFRSCCSASGSSAARPTTSRCTTSSSARAATEHLLGIGRRRIAVIGAHPNDQDDMSSANLRMRGYRRALDGGRDPVRRRARAGRRAMAPRERRGGDRAHARGRGRRVRRRLHPQRHARPRRAARARRGGGPRPGGRRRHRLRQHRRVAILACRRCRASTRVATRSPRSRSICCSSASTRRATRCRRDRSRRTSGSFRGSRRAQSEPEAVRSTAFRSSSPAQRPPRSPALRRSSERPRAGLTPSIC